MADLTSTEKLKLEKLLDMSGGYVLNFNNRTFDEFVLENVHVDIRQSRFDCFGSSKANRLRAFWKLEGNKTVGCLLEQLLEYWKVTKELNNQSATFTENVLFEECREIAKHLRNDSALVTPQPEPAKDDGKDQEHQLDLLLGMFDEQATSTDHQKRGYFLQELLKQLFRIHDIPVTKSFQRNSGGEQIDGAFMFQGWHYIVECKWTKKLADIRELDSLLGKVNRSGKQTMGLFLSIDGWSENVPQLLKQNPEKCIILMEGYDLRCILSKAIGLEPLLNAKLTHLNLESEPFLSARGILD